MGSSPPRDNDLNRPSVNPGHLCVGCINWLPKFNGEDEILRCINKNCCDFSPLDIHGYGHPVVVLRIRQREGSSTLGDLICTIGCVTTFGSTPLEKYKKTKARRPHMDASIPICNPESKPPIESPQSFGSLETVITLEQSNLKKQSYVRLPHAYEVPVSMLRTFGYGPYARTYKPRISETGYASLTLLFGMGKETYEITNTLFETASSRLNALARSQLPPDLFHRSTQSAIYDLPIADPYNHLLIPTVSAYDNSPRVIKVHPGHRHYGTTSTTQATTEELLPQHHSFQSPISAADDGYRDIYKKVLLVILSLVFGGIFFYHRG